jgi:hypothetical protein
MNGFFSQLPLIPGEEVIVFTGRHFASVSGSTEYNFSLLLDIHFQLR